MSKVNIGIYAKAPITIKNDFNYYKIVTTYLRKQLELNIIF